MSGKYLIVGLGNPGRQYTQTRHNAGFWVIDELAKRHKIDNFKSERKALVADGVINGKRVILAKPQTYMNLSGESLRALVDFYKIERENLIVIHDELDLPLGTLRFKKTGGHGGQNGIRNIILHYGQDFARARFGIGRPAGKMQGADYVLSKPNGEEAILIQQVIESTANAIEHWLKEGIDLTMSRYNGDISENGTKGKQEPSQSNVKEKLKLAQRAHELNPKDPKPLEEMARLHKQLRQLDEAARAHLLLAELYHEQGKPKQMLHEWEIAAKMRPMLVELREEIARGYEEHDEDNKRAVQTWQKLAEYHANQGNMAAAMQAIQEAARLNPQHPKTLELQEQFKKRLTT